jgi:hypothetical protein
MSAEAREKMAKAATGRTVSAATRDKHRAFMSNLEKNPLYKPVDMEPVAALVRGGMLGKEIAARLGVSLPTLYSKIRKHYGVQLSELRKRLTVE